MLRWSRRARRQREAPRTDTGRMAGEADVIHRIAERTGRLGLELVDVAGNVDDVSAHVSREASQFAELTRFAEQMAEFNKTVDEAAEAAQSVATRAARDVEHSRGTIRESIGDIRGLAAAVTDSGSRLSYLEDALTQVAGVARGISGIARQTNLLALNATIEASRAGEAGRGFAVVAEEVKELARQTGEATTRIDQTLGELSSQVRELVRRGEESTSQATRVQEGTQAIQAVMESVAGAIAEVDRESGRIVGAVREIDRYCGETASGLAGLTHEVERSAGHLDTARERINRLLGFTEELVNITLESDTETEDSPFVRHARATAAAVSRTFEQAVAEGRITVEALFDRDYQPIAGTDPQQYLSRYTRFTDEVLPPLQEPVRESDPRISACCTTDDRGYIATHALPVSQPQRPDDPVWNAANCRNRRIFDDRVGKAAAANRRPFLLQVYRRDMGGGDFQLFRDASAPVTVNGRHWGAVRVIYRL